MKDQSKDQSKVRSEELINAFSWRILAIIVIGSTEMMIKHWLDKLTLFPFKDYFKDRTRNDKKLELLLKGFRYFKLPFDQNIVKDYFAVKIVRNAIIHSELKDRDRKILKGRGFPIDITKLNSEHWNKMQEIYFKMMQYIALIGIKHGINYENE